MLTISDKDKNKKEAIPDITAKKTCSPVQQLSYTNIECEIIWSLLLLQSNIKIKN